MFDKILVVCVGNICRSPTAEHMLRARLPHKHVRSAGLATEKSGLAGNGIDAQAKSIAAQHGLMIEDHVATQISNDLVKWADLVLVMEQGHREQLARMYPEARGKTLLLGNWLGAKHEAKDIPDPYRKSDEAFIFVYELLEAAVDSWVNKLN
ncbi:MULTISPECIES: low molecular weight protein-tyrosine-phosphatase [Idiomarinaceae]|uniref:protein-tyrosine-phosphatase n=2 Tax=Pseudidiomarina TaxID=2800384 RepID=A0AB39XB46_9GAMM|nr:MULTISPECIES: low molecular weight protein-tyrosine-phosphatase [Idiomarinaceae]MDT7526305.1 low molecular weight phosphotyrosine protein phosphatase [Pseudidiomarina sp. GXY010]MRJ42542.1 low molecular weight phosphotyrosine protein phosphatase [Idiomarina sp. FeN1]NCU58155.1 low molecular weight phosphotyrosine protein phosphatase [Idiomarina sp. FenA--70]NCU60853.1 low molecular weight phosphotyrosine protein phosphatase [Idiomarina sp. FenBw--71]UUN12751.1 low molecular weight phosphoty